MAKFLEKDEIAMKRLVNLTFYGEEDSTTGTGNDDDIDANVAPVAQEDLSDEAFLKEIDDLKYGQFNKSYGEIDNTADGGEVHAPDEPRTPPAAQQQVVTPPAEPSAQEQSIKQQMERYAPLVGAIENDPVFRQMVADAIEKRRNGVVPGQAPQAQVETDGKTVKDDELEPVQGEDEIYEDFAKRHAAWEGKKREREINEQVRQAFENQLKAQAAQVQTQQFMAQAQSIHRLVAEDPNREQVARFIQGNYLPPSLVNLMDVDPDVFMFVYDGISQINGYGNYFAKKLQEARAAQTSEQAEQQQAQTAVQTTQVTPATSVAQGGRTVLKTQAPFVENGGGVTQGSGDAARMDFSNMGEKEFALFMQKVKMQGI